jgi:hypothetical protein
MARYRVPSPAGPEKPAGYVPFLAMGRCDSYIFGSKFVSILYAGTRYFCWAKRNSPEMTSTGQSEQQRYRPNAMVVSRPPALPNHGVRLLLLAAGGFLIVRIALAFLQLT